jgi:putative flippase GtrA
VTSPEPRATISGRVRHLLALELVRYGIVGVVNTLFGYGLFVVMQLTLGRVIQYTIVQAASNIIATVQAYWFQRWLVFRHTGNWWVGLAKFASVYSGAFFFSLGFVALLVEVFKVDILVAGAITVVLQAFGTYAANKWFTFRSGGGDSATGKGSGRPPGSVARIAIVPECEAQA